MTEPSITVLLESAKQGNVAAANKLWESVYGEIRNLAQRALEREHARPSIQATELAHEAFLRLQGEEELAFENRSHLLATVARAMRRLLVDRARYRKANKRGGGLARVLLDDVIDAMPDNIPDILDLDEALTELEVLDSRHARLVELRFFGGMTLDEAADTIGIARRTAAGDWALAKSWLRRRLEGKHHE